MSVATTRLSSKGQVVIPKDIRNALRWEPGKELAIVVTESGLLLHSPVSTSKSGSLADLVGMLRHEGPAVSLDELCAPVDYRADWEESERRSR